MRIESDRTGRRLMLTPLASLLIVVLLLSFAHAGVIVNLPRLDKQVSIQYGVNEALLTFLYGVDVNKLSELDDLLAQVLIEVLPDEYRIACDTTISHWGTQAENTADMSVRAIYAREVPDGGPRQILLVYRCFSHYEYYLDRFYDERLALLTVGDSVSTLQMLPHENECDGCSDLSRIAVENVLRIEGEPMVAVVFSMSSDNPCCNGPYSYSGEKVYYYRLGPQGATLVAQMPKRKAEYFHDDVSGDVEVIYDAALELLSDADGDVFEIVSDWVVQENDVIKESGQDRYIYNQQRMVFEKVVE